MVPGIGGSAVEHWQSIWEPELGADRMLPSSWDEPEESDWFAALEARQSPDTIIVAHSLGCLAVTAWLVRAQPSWVVGAFLVSPPDRQGAVFPRAASSFTAVLEPLPVPSMVVASSNDPFAAEADGRAMAEAWGARYVGAGAFGHLNGASGLGQWDQGRALLEHFVSDVAVQRANV